MNSKTSAKIKNLSKSLMLLVLLTSASSCATGFLNRNYDPFNAFCVAVGKVPEQFVWNDAEQFDAAADFLYNYIHTHDKICLGKND